MTSLDEKIEKTRNSLRTERMDISFGEIIRMYQDKEMIIAPEYQRLFRWDETQRTKFIESLLLGIPIPPIFVAENDKKEWEVVDGLQRVSTVLTFCSALKATDENKNLENLNGWKLEKGDLIKEIEGKTYELLSRETKFLIKRYICRVEIIKSNSEYDMRYQLFERLNTGGSILTDQEIRNCIFRGDSEEFNEFLNIEGKKEEFIDLIGPTLRQKKEMMLEELVLRFCSLYNNMDNIKHSISQHMTEFMRDNVKDIDKLEELKIIWKRTIELLETQESEIFRSKKRVFSTTLYDGIVVGLAQNIDKYENNNEKLVEKINELIKTFYDENLIGLAHSKNNLKKRIKRADEIFND